MIFLYKFNFTNIKKIDIQYKKTLYVLFTTKNYILKSFKNNNDLFSDLWLLKLLKNEFKKAYFKFKFKPILCLI